MFTTTMVLISANIVFKQVLYSNPITVLPPCNCRRVYSIEKGTKVQSSKHLNDIVVQYRASHSVECVMQSGLFLVLVAPRVLLPL